MKNSRSKTIVSDDVMQQKIIQLTKIKQWYLPVDAESYNILKRAGVPLIRIHENFIPTLSLITKPRNIKAQLVNFNDAILHPYLDEIGRRWQLKTHRKATINASVLKFETTHASIHTASKEALVKLEVSLRRFFTRWGYSATFEPSESRGKCKLHVTYKYDSNRLPIIPLVEDATSLPAITIDIGFVRLRLTMGEREVEMNISIAAGPTWTSLQTTRCLYSQISDVRPFITSLMKVVNRDPTNFENKRLDISNPSKIKSDPVPTMVAKPGVEAHHYIKGPLLPDGKDGPDVRVVGVHKGVTGFTGNITGDTTNVFGNWPNVTGDVSALIGDLSNLSGILSCVRGTIDPKLFGDMTFLKGVLTGITGKVRSSLRGDLTGKRGDISGVWGDGSNATGDMSGIHGDLTGLTGDLTGISNSKKTI